MAKSKQLEIPATIGFEFTPSYTPEMNPIEQVWCEIRKCDFKNKAFKMLEVVIDKLQEVIQDLDRDTFRSIVSRKWKRFQLDFCKV